MPVRMKFYSPFVLCFCITIAAGSHNYGHPLLMSLPQHHAVKRQANPDQEQVCEDIAVREICSNGFYEDYAYLAAQCRQREAAESFQDVCSINSMGTICATIDGPDFDDFNSMCDSVNTTCSSGCMDFLTSTRARLGCCLNGYNSTDDTDDTMYSYALWSLCGVEPVTEQCTPSFDLPTGTDPTCNPDNVEDQLYQSVLCRFEFMESVRNALRAENCDDQTSSSFCAVDEQGSYCALRDNLYDQQRIASNNCRDTDTCDPVCIETLSNITSVSGCCFISEFNSTAETKEDWLSYEFWQRCGLTSPGFCEEKFTSGPRISSALRKAPGIVTIIVLFVVLLVSPF